MEVTANEMYWLLTLDSIHSLLTGIIVVLAILGFVIPATGAKIDEHDDNNPTFKVAFWIGLGCWFCFLAFAGVKTFLPNTKQMAMIKVVPAIVNSDFAKELSGDAKDVYKLGIEAIKEQLKGGDK